MSYEVYAVEKGTRKEGHIYMSVMDRMGDTTLNVPVEYMSAIVDITKDQLKAGKWAYLRDEQGNEDVVKDFECDFADMDELRRRLSAAEEVLFAVALVGGRD